MGETVIRAGTPTLRDGIVTWSGDLVPTGADPARVSFRFTTTDPDRLPTSPRPFLLACLLAAMRVGDPVVVEGEIDECTVSGLMEWQEAMVSWHRGHLQVVSLRAEGYRVAVPAPTDRGWITAFSGGVDSSFTAVRNRPGAVGPAHHRRSPVAAGLMVHGFDIDLDDGATFQSAFARSARMLEALGIDALRMHTDVRALEGRFPVDWETASHAIWLASALACLEEGYAGSLIPSTYPYDHQRLPWASNPLTDPLLGSGTHPLRHDGAAFDKLAKVEALVGVDAVERDLRVCWQGEHLDRNCGRCFKCVTTQACFWVSGVPEPRCFDRPAALSDLAAVRFSDPYKRSLACRLRTRAGDAGMPGIVAAIDEALP